MSTLIKCIYMYSYFCQNLTRAVIGSHRFGVEDKLTFKCRAIAVAAACFSFIMIPGPLSGA